VGSSMLSNRVHDHRGGAPEATCRGSRGCKTGVQRRIGCRMGGRIHIPDVRCLRAAQLDFPVMVRRRLITLYPDRLNAERVAGQPRAGSDGGPGCGNELTASRPTA
jgi:hypothetical protein